MTFSTTAREIAEEYAAGWGDATADNLERAILRHMEHHVGKALDQMREHCAQVAEQPCVVSAADEGKTVNAIIAAHIRALGTRSVAEPASGEGVNK